MAILDTDIMDPEFFSVLYPDARKKAVTLMPVTAAAIFAHGPLDAEVGDHLTRMLSGSPKGHALLKQARDPGKHGPEDSSP